MHPFHQRMAQIWDKARRGQELSVIEIREWVESLNAHLNWVSELNRLENLADAAAVVGDSDWENEICKKMDQLIYKH